MFIPFLCVQRKKKRGEEEEKMRKRERRIKRRDEDENEERDKKEKKNEKKREVERRRGEIPPNSGLTYRHVFLFSRLTAGLLTDNIEFLFFSCEK